MSKVVKTLGDFTVTERDLDFVVTSKKHRIERLVIPRDPRTSAAFAADDAKAMEKAIADSIAVRRMQKPNRATRRDNLRKLRTQVKKSVGKDTPLSVIGKGLRATAKAILGKGEEPDVTPPDATEQVEGSTKTTEGDSGKGN